MNERSHQLDTKDSSFLPKNWVWTTLGEIGTVASGGTPSTKEPSNFDGEIPWVTPADLSGYTKKFIGRGRRNLTKSGLDHSSAALLPAGAVLFSSRAPVGYVAIASNPLATNQGFKNLILHDWISPEYVYYYLRASKELAESFASGTTFLEVSASRFVQIPVPLCPTPEQCRIVAKVEELFTKLDAGIKSLETVKVQLKRYRQSVLNSAFDGKLTEEWRRTHRDELEPASKLLEHIKEERTSTTGKHKEHPPLDTSNLPELTEGWIWTRVGDIAKTIHYGFTASSTEKCVGPKMLRITDIQDNFVIWEAVPYCRIESPEKERYLLNDGDLVFARTGATVGKSYLIRGSIPEAVFASYLIRIILSDHVRKEFVYDFFQSYMYWLQINQGKIGIGQPNVNSQTLSRIILPLPPLLEQHRIVEEIEQHFSIVNEVEKTVIENSRRAEKLRQSILKCAFEGKLVSQDPSDEPASVLLERIKSLKAQMILDQKAKKGRQNDSKQRRLT
jgi:type I restriction enzyme S subunit